MKKEKVAAVTIQPLGDRVLVKPQVAQDEKSPFGIIIPDTARKEKPERGVVVAVGEGRRTEKGDLIPVRVAVGDEVMFSKYGFDEIKIGDVEYYIVSESSVLAIITK
jgi:chaperonin GroES